ncbi:beta-ketoacyl-[acyl-carrier-protein] synthase family protein [Christiangramia forsetii]|uniref:3-oxoacyl-[acyl-carrier-protein] synthase n=2 Tax=Christiangramia forsetii TaxID=411153 RepID=A0M1Y8_CHRFK|nr:beta-ketoacyl-[acyl-carrier-protein] synthase family protein [Christiangramia forsetii]GGG45017.1 beta-ACP synthase [Christiangramia forsetii]CAL66633.1 3-oxoacyl-[acyl-carrier-protein] synthase [Christiangramia forsetii KT0803]
MRGVTVTGMGIISAIGRNLKETHLSLKNEKDGITFPEILATNIKHLPVGEIKLSNSELSRITGLPKDHSYTRAALLGVFAIKELMENSGYDQFPEDTGLISGTSIGGIDMTEKYFLDYKEDPENRKYIQAQHPGFTTEKIAEYFSLNGMVTTISTACSSSANAIMMGAKMIESGRLKRVIVGGSDCLTKFTLNGFNSLKILSEQKSRLFDNARNGLNLGEAAGYLLLEAEDCIEKKKVLGRVSGYGNANDAYHQTASSENGEGAYQAITKALKKAGLSSSDIDYINAHGTGTRNNDLSESVALKRIFGDKVPCFSSTKGFTGHTLGASGAIEAIFSLLAIQNKEIFSNLNFENKMSETALEPVTKLQNKSVETVLSNSFGFGGNCTSLIFQRYG